MDWLLKRIDVDRFVNDALAYLPSIFAAVVVLFAFWVAYRITRVSFRAILRRGGLHETLIGMLVDNIYKLVLMAFGVVMAADQLGVNVGAALAGLGVAGIAVGFAAQDSLSNTIAGFVVFWDKPFEVGDWVTVADQYGRVSDITMRSTRIRTNNNTYVVIPNKSIIDQVLVNHSKHGETRIDVPIGIAYKENIPQARKVLLEAVQNLQGVAASPPPDVVTTETADSSVNLLVRVWIEDAGQEQPVYFRTLEASKLALDAAGIQIPFPHLQLFVDNVEDRVWKHLPWSGPAAGGTEVPPERN